MGLRPGEPSFIRNDQLWQSGLGRRGGRGRGESFFKVRYGICGKGVVLKDVERRWNSDLESDQGWEGEGVGGGGSPSSR